MAGKKPDEFDEIKAQVLAEGGAKAFRMELLRNAAAYGKLGKWVVIEIGNHLRRRGLGHAPDPLPADSWATVLVYQLGSDIEKVVHAVTSPSPEGADTIRAFVNQDAAEALDRIRALLEASTSNS